VPDPAVKIEALAAALGVSTNLISRRVKSGTVPPPDVALWLKRPTAWRLSTIRLWCPDVAAKIQRGIDAEIFPYLAAA